MLNRPVPTSSHKQCLRNTTMMSNCNESMQEHMLKAIAEPSNHAEPYARCSIRCSHLFGWSSVWVVVAETLQSSVWVVVAESMIEELSY